MKAKNGLETLDLAEKTAADYSQLRSYSIPTPTTSSDKSTTILPYTIDSEYATSPRLEGYATIEMKINSRKGFKFPNSFKTENDMLFTLTVDGFHAPLTAGNFVGM